MNEINTAQERDFANSAAYHVGLFCGFIAKQHGTSPELIANALSILIEEAATRLDHLLETNRSHDA